MERVCLLVRDCKGLGEGGIGRGGLEMGRWKDGCDRGEALVERNDDR